MDTGLDQRPGYPGCDIHAGVNLVSQTRVPTGKRGTGAGRALRWSRRALWSRTRPGANFIPVDGDRAVRPRSFSAYNGRSRPFGRRRVPVAMVVAAWAALLVAIAFVVQAGGPGHLGRHAVLREICASRARGRKADRGGRARSGLPGLPGHDVRVRRRPRHGGAPAAGGVGRHHSGCSAMSRSRTARTTRMGNLL